MSAVEASIDTARAGRYLAQLCEHLQHLMNMPRTDPPAGRQPPVINSMRHDDNAARIEFELGLLTVMASTAQLKLRAESDSDADLAMLQRMVADRLATIGRRDELTVRWQPAE